MSALTSLELGHEDRAVTFRDPLADATRRDDTAFGMLPSTIISLNTPVTPPRNHLYFRRRNSLGALRMSALGPASAGARPRRTNRLGSIRPSRIGSRLGSRHAGCVHSSSRDVSTSDEATSNVVDYAVT